ncbi:hypothetical protein T439DRAFT_380738 [Meredithblackwellia eburnea MCA 4105]
MNDDDDERSFYDLLAPANDQGLDVLVHAIDNNSSSNEPSSVSQLTFPSISAFLNPDTGSMSIDSLLAASQQLAAPGQKSGSKGHALNGDSELLGESNGLNTSTGGSSSWLTGSSTTLSTFATEDDFVSQLQQLVSPNPPSPRPYLTSLPPLAPPPPTATTAAPSTDQDLFVPDEGQKTDKGKHPLMPKGKSTQHPKKKAKAAVATTVPLAGPSTSSTTSSATKAGPEQPRAGPSKHPTPATILKPFEQLAERQAWTKATLEERRAKIRKAIVEGGIGSSVTLPMKPSSLNNILCFHGSVAQKSYGNEKRLFCPPPHVRIEGPMKDLEEKPILKMAIVAGDTGCRDVDETTRLLESQMRYFFRKLHVGGTAAKGKHINLELSLHGQPSAKSTQSNSPENFPAPPPHPHVFGPSFATLSSANVAIISKPSKKTAKARNTNSCIFAGSTICLHNRINSQTVRTKYMAVEEGRMCARQNMWTAFSIHVLRRAEDIDGESQPTLATSKVLNGAATVSYGSEVLLTDLLTGISSEPLILRKVDKKHVLLDDASPVSQLQRLAFSRIIDGKSAYLSASPDGMDSQGTRVKRSSASPAPDEVFDSAAGGKKKRRREGDDDEEEISTKGTLTYVYPDKMGESDGRRFHEVDDILTWTVTGVASFSYSFFDAFAGSTPALPSALITPFPTVSAPPQHHPESNQISVNVSNFFHLSESQKPTALEVFLGPIGPLKTQVLGGYMGTAPAELTAEETFLSLDLPPIHNVLQASISFSSASTPTLPTELSGADIEKILADNSTSSSAFLSRSLGSLSDVVDTTTQSSDNNAFNPLSDIGGSSARDIPTTIPSSDRASTSDFLDPLNSLTGPISLPLIFVNTSSGIGYLSGRWIVAERLVASEMGVHESTSWQVRIV